MSAVQPAGAGPAADRRSRMTAPVLSGLGAVAAVTLLHVRDPHVPGSYGGCPLLYLTGIYCPGCGGLRAVHDLTHGDLVAALSSNLVAVALLLPLAVVVWVAWARSRWRGGDRPAPALTRSVVWPVLVLLLAFGLVRNLPVGSWLAP